MVLMMLISAVARHLLADRRWEGLVVGNTPATGVAAQLVHRHLAQGCLIRGNGSLSSPTWSTCHRTLRVTRPCRGATAERSGTSAEQARAACSSSARMTPVACSIKSMRFTCVDGTVPSTLGTARAFHFALAPVLQKRGALRLSRCCIFRWDANCGHVQRSRGGYGIQPPKPWACCSIRNGRPASPPGTCILATARRKRPAMRACGGSTSSPVGEIPAVQAGFQSTPRHLAGDQGPTIEAHLRHVRHRGRECTAVPAGPAGMTRFRWRFNDNRHARYYGHCTYVPPYRVRLQDWCEWTGRLGEDAGRGR